VSDKMRLPILPIKNTVLFPYIHMPFSVGRQASVHAVEAALASGDKEILVVCQRESAEETPDKDDLYPVGVKAVIKKVLRTDDVLQIIVLGRDRVRIDEFHQTEPHIEAQATLLPLPTDSSDEVEALQRELVELGLKALSLTQPQAPPEVSRTFLTADNPMQLAFTLATNFGMDVEKQQALLEA